MSTWIDAAARDDVPQDDVTNVQLDGHDIALYGVDGHVYATDNLCTHGRARLCDGFLEGHEIECPLHQGRFDVPQDDVTNVQLDGRDIALYGVDGHVYATDNLCTHGHARLCDGFLEGHEIECPLHQGRFDVRSGQPTCAPVTEALKTYPVRIEGARVYVQLG